MPNAIARILRLTALTIQIISPLVGVLVFGWDITEVVFIFGVEAAVMAGFHAYKYSRTYRQLPAGDHKRFYGGTATVRVGMEIVLVIGAFTVFIDSVLGYRSTVFDDPQVLVQYLFITLVPVLAIVAHYIQAITRFYQQPITRVSITPIWIWIFQLPLPGLVYSYLLSSHYTSWLLGLLSVLTLSRVIVEWYQATHSSQVSNTNPTDPLLLQSSPYSTAGVLSMLFSYLLVLMGFLAVNPFTQDPKFTPTQNALIYLGCIIVLIPVLHRRQISAQIHPTTQTITVERGRYWKRQRTIVFADITEIEIQRNQQHMAYQCTFHLRGQRPWKCSNSPFAITDWHAWLRRLNVIANLNMPKL